MHAARNGNLSIRVTCGEALRRWRIIGSCDISDSPIEVEAGALIEAENDWNLSAIRAILERRES